MIIKPAEPPVRHPCFARQPVLFDRFEDVDNTPITSHTPDVGPAITYASSTRIVTLGGQITQNAVGWDLIHYKDPMPARARYAIDIVLVGNEAGFEFRNGNGTLFRLAVSRWNVCTLKYKDANGITVVASANVPQLSGLLEVFDWGNVLDVRFNHAPLYTYAPTAPAGGYGCGVYLNSVTATGVCALDNFVVEGI